MFAVKARWLIASADKVYEDYGFLVEDGRVVKLLPNKEIDTLRQSDGAGDGQNIRIQDILDASDKIVLPGFINAHMHQYGMLSHGIPVDVEITGFRGFLEDFWWPYVENRISPYEVYITAKASAVEMIKSGVTGYCDTLEAPYAGAGVLANQAQAVKETGLRAILSIESCERISRKNGLACIKENMDFIKSCRQQQSLIEGMMCIHTTFTCSAEFLQEAKAEADSVGARWQFHLSESPYEPEQALKHLGKRPAVYYNDLGLLDGRTLASQCVQVDSTEIEILREQGVAVVHMPLSNCEVGGGVAPVPQMLARGLAVGLGSDGYINDFFTVMKGAFLIHKAYQQNPAAMPAREVFRMATELGAKALGWENAGILKEGCKADFIVVDNSFPTPLTAGNIFDQLVVYGQKEYVDSVFTAGRPLLRNKQLISLDEEKINREMREAARKFWEGI